MNIEIYYYYEKGQRIPIFFNNNSKMGKEWDKLCHKLMLQNAVPNRLTYDDFIRNMEIKGVIPTVS